MFLLNIKVEILVHSENNHSVGFCSSVFHEVASLSLFPKFKIEGEYVFNTS